MDKIKAFFTEHKKAIIIGTAVVVTVAAGAIAYKLYLNNTEALEAIADANVAEELTEAIGEIVNKA